MRRQIKTIKDYQELIKFIAVNAHNLLVDSYIPGEKTEFASQFMKKCKEIVEQLESDNE